MSDQPIEPTVDETAPAPEPTVEPIPRFESESEIPSTAPKYLVLGNALVAQTSNGPLRAPLFFPTKRIRAIPDGLNLLDQVYFIFVEDSDLCAALDELDISESNEFASHLHRAYSEKQQARLGK